MLLRSAIPDMRVRNSSAAETISLGVLTEPTNQTVVRGISERNEFNDMFDLLPVMRAASVDRGSRGLGQNVPGS
jgi:hypothetical protein